MDKYTLKASLRETLAGIIWKLETDSKYPLIAIETRHPDERSASFSLFNYQTGECLYKNVGFDESWHWNLDKIYEGSVLLHSYLHPGTPEHSGILAFDSSGSIKWQLFNKTLFDLAEEGLIVYDPKVAPKKLECADISTGQLSKLMEKGYRQVTGSIDIPDVLDNIDQFKDYLKDDLHGPVYYKVKDKKLILAYHTRQEKLFRQQLTVIQDGVSILDDILDDGIQKMNPEAFFIDHGYLFYIRQKQELVSYFV